MKPDKERLLLEDMERSSALDEQVQLKRERGIFTLGFLAGVLLSLSVVLLLLFGSPHKLVFDDPFSGLQEQPAEGLVEVTHIEQFEVGWFDQSASSGKSSDNDGDRAHLEQRNQTKAPSCSAEDNNRFDCWPEFYEATQEKCEARGCCWDSSLEVGNFPTCFYPDNYVSYVVSSSSPAKGADMTAKLTKRAASPYPDDVSELQVDVVFQSENVVRFRIIDPSKQRFEVPMNLSTGSKRARAEDTDYKVTFQNSPFGILISRKSTGAILFDSRNMAPLVYADQFLQIGTRLTSPNIYGLGEHQGPLKLDINWNKLVMWNRDMAPDGGGNLYGSHPFYLNLESDGNAHGVFLFSSNALEVALQPYGDGVGALTYRALGGVLDFFVFTGPSPVQVVEQYVSLIGRPTMPPFWALGFHLCRYGYFSTANLTAIIQRNRAAKIPYDVQWNDIDYMEAYKDWTYDANGNYSGLNKVVDDLHQHDQRYVMIIDPGISSTQKPGTYPPYDQGVQMDVFIKNASGQILIGKVWPGLTAFPDFFHPNSNQYWFNQMKSYHDQISFDGIWDDMNEISNFFDGSTVGCTSGPLDKPPYVPPGINGKTLHAKTICPSAKQFLSTNYNLHNMYGWSEMRATQAGLTKLLGKRSFVLSRSTFPGAGKFGAHWSGDNKSAWPDLYFSIPSILTINLFGIPLIGADICGFLSDTNRELCIRWMQLGSFYPFMRNHASSYTKPQDPAAFDSQAVDYMRTALETRYSLLPFMYTWFYLSHTTGTPVVRPLFMLFPGTEGMDKQFMWGESLLVSPVLAPELTKVDAYIPPGQWYDLYNGSVLTTEGDQWLELDAPLSKINAHVRGGSIIPRLPPALTTNQMRKSPFGLFVAPDAQSSAHGMLYWDDGESLDTVEMNKYTLLNFTLTGSTLKSTVIKGNYPGMKLSTIAVVGIASSPKSVTANGKPVNFVYEPSLKVLSVAKMDVDLLTPFTISWA